MEISRRLSRRAGSIGVMIANGVQSMSVVDTRRSTFN